MDNRQTSPTVTLTRAQRDVLSPLAGDDLGSIGDTLYHAALRRDLGAARRPAGTLRALHDLLDLLDTLGWGDPDDERAAYPVDLPAEALGALLERWRDQLDGVMRDQARGGDLSADDRAQVDADLDARLAVAQVLEQVNG